MYEIFEACNQLQQTKFSCQTDSEHHYSTNENATVVFSALEAIAA
jgi:hypothetical protein